MKIRCFLLGSALFVAANLQAQKDSTEQHPGWAAGLYGGISAGYGFFSQPFKEVGQVSPVTATASPGPVFNLDGGLAFRNRLGIRLLVSGFSANSLSRHYEQKLEKDYPGYFASYVPQDGDPKHGLVNHASIGLSYAMPYRRWYFQPELLFGSTAINSYWAIAQLKENGTHQAIVRTYRPENSEYRSPTLVMGGRAAWYAGWYVGFFAEARGFALWNRVKYQVSSHELIPQTLERETIEIKRTAFGAVANIGMFLQIGRWEMTKRNLKKLLF